MRLHRFIGNFDFNTKNLAVTDSELVSQWRNVLRLKTGDTVILCDGKGHEAHGTITNMDKKGAHVTIDEIETPDRDPIKDTTLYCAVLKRENFELVVQKATEIGIARIVPLLTERTVKTGFNRERLEKIIREACEQSGRTTLPELSNPLNFSESVENIKPNEAVLFDLSGSEIASFKPLKLQSCFIGPEGGFTEAEVLRAKEAGCAIASLGNLTLRGETAAIVASYLLVK